MYQKPVINILPDTAEGVYLASGEGTVVAGIKENTKISQKVYAEATYSGTEVSKSQVFTITFTQPVEYLSCNGQGAHLISGNDTTTLTIGLSYEVQPGETIRFDKLYVEAEPNLAVVSYSMSYN